MMDKTLRKHVEDELEWTPHVNAANIGVIAENGVVRLTGHVPSYAQKLEAGRAVQALHGVRALVNDLEVRPPVLADNSDESIAARAADLIDWDVTIPRGLVRVAVHDGVVTLTGEVGAQHVRDAAERCVRNLHGAKDVLNQITVKATVVSADIERRIREALDRQADLEAKGIEVSIHGDKVKISGTVKAAFERAIIERAVWAAPGVRAVEDLVTVERPA
jgi:osmotically-inducible protein OsmY